MEEAKVIVKILFLVGLSAIPFLLKGPNYFYWLVLVVWLALYWMLKITSVKSLYFTLWLFFIASFIKLLGINNIAEFAFILSLISLIIGVSQATFELSMKD